MSHFKNFDQVLNCLKKDFLYFSNEVHTLKWQGIEVKNKPDMAMRELLDLHFKVPLRFLDLQHYRDDIKPNLPWADDHFKERVCGKPINPGIEWKNWPYNKSADTFREGSGQFNHNYMERLWPNFGIEHEATTTVEEYEQIDDLVAQQGLRHPYGGLRDVVNLLRREPDTRQAFLPIWFPEDTGVVHGNRVPCTIGYQFLMRNNYLHMVYYIRSCDYTRHLRDDIYLAVRLLLWILDELRDSDPNWDKVVPGFYSMHIMNLHIFKNDYLVMKNENK